MENDQIFEAEASREASEYGHTGRDQNGADKMEVAARVATNSGYDNQLDSRTSEDSPLLSNEPVDATDGWPDDNGDANGGEWHGAKDFEGLPWWRTPSVRTN
jgi:hypothetical protein